MSDKLPLRIISFLVPSLPVELFENVSHYLEEALQRETLLYYESRFTGPQADRADPFRTNLADLGTVEPSEANLSEKPQPEQADLAFISGSSYQQLMASGNKEWELLPVGMVHPHPTRGEALGYFADIIIHRDSRDRIKDFLDLRGARWATSDEASLSGHLLVLRMLREKGENASFFGNVLHSGSHLGSVQMVALKQAEVASVDSNALAFGLEKNASLRDEVVIFDSFGPLPPYPIMARASLPDHDKEAIVQALLRLNDNGKWHEKLKSLRVNRFEKVDPHVFDLDRETRTIVKDLTAAVPYY